MRTTLSLLLATLTLAAAAFGVACAAPSDEDGEAAGEGSAAALTGTIEEARACAIEKAYQAAPLSAFKPAYGDAGLYGGSMFKVTSIGEVFIIEWPEAGGTLSTFEVDNVVKVKATTRGGVMSWQLPSGAALKCGSTGNGVSVADAGR